MIGGVCGGIGAYFNVDPTVIRIVWVIIALVSFPAGLVIGAIAYGVSMFVIPRNPDEVSLMETQGLDADEPVTEPRDIQSNGLIWGIVLGLLGLVILTHTNFLPFHMHWRGGGALIPLALVGVGVYLMFKYRPDMVEKIKSFSGERKLYRSTTDKKVFGVCGGLAESFQIDVTLVRLGWALGTIVTNGIGIPIYLLMAFILPKGRPNTTQEA
jgi:phage shock protein PspC (stress-responsive transcriptional regulator)